MIVLDLIFGFLRSRWGGVIAAGGLFLATLGLLITLGFAKHDTAVAKRQAADLSDSIEHPGTGFKARLNQCQTNNLALNDAVSRQNEALTAIQSEADKRAAEGAAALQRERQVTAGLRGQIASLAAKRAHPGESEGAACGRIILEGVADE